MNVYIMTDIEGISGIVSKDQVLKNSPMYQEGRRLMTAEINVCVKACKEAGADVLVAGSAYYKAEDKTAFVKLIQY